MSAQLNDRLAVCSWSLQPSDAADLLSMLDALDLPRVQLALDPLLESPEVWRDLPHAAGVTIVSGMFGTFGEDYTTLETIRESGGVVPDVHWEKNWRHIQAAADLAADLGLSLVSFHAGFLPHEKTDPDYLKLKARLMRIAACFADKGIALAFETGQETAANLRDFLEDLACPNVGVNFDPANMILYGKGDPIEAMRLLGPWIRQVHIKDAIATTQPGTWGKEVVAGAGQVDWKAFFASLSELGFTGNLCIEREAGNQRAADILTAKQMVATIACRPPSPNPSQP